MNTWEGLQVSQKEMPRAGLVKAGLAGQITNRQGAEALDITVRQFRRLKRRYEAPGVLTAARDGKRLGEVRLELLAPGTSAPLEVVLHNLLDRACAYLRPLLLFERVCRRGELSAFSIPTGLRSGLAWSHVLTRGPRPAVH